MPRIPDTQPIDHLQGNDSLPIWDASIARLRHATIDKLRAAFGLPGDYLTLRRSGFLSMKGNIWEPVGWTHVIRSTGRFGNEVPSSNITIPVSGYYEASFYCDISPSNGTRQIEWRLAVNGSWPQGWAIASIRDSYGSIPCIGKAWYLSAGDQLSGEVRCEGTSAFANVLSHAGITVVRVG